jgi:hypothetical protein
MHGGEVGQAPLREPSRPADAEPRPQRMETPADWTPYPPIADDDAGLPEPEPSMPREEPAHAGNGGRSEAGDLSADIGAPATEPSPPEQPPVEQPVATPHMESREPKRRGWWQRIVE